MNLCVVGRDTWQSLREAEHLPARPAGGVLYGREVPQSRIGLLPPEPRDKWWRVYSGQDTDSVADDVLSDLAGHGLPWLRAMIDSTA